MGQQQQRFLEHFKGEFERRFSEHVDWTGGQKKGNRGRLHCKRGPRRLAKPNPGEHFELGDLRGKFGDYTIIVEFDSAGPDLRNLLKYWPYVRGETAPTPSLPLLLCHFSGWSSYGAYRDLWQWVLERMQNDCPGRLHAKQFDHWDDDKNARERSVCEAIDWLDKVMAKPTDSAGPGPLASFSP